MRLVTCFRTTFFLFGGCTNVEYRDTNASVDARPECADSENARKGEGVPAWCERGATTELWSTKSQSSAISFDGKGGG